MPGDRIRLLVTGLDGFVGAHVQRIASATAEVVGLCAADGRPVDLRDRAAVSAAVAAARPDRVLHLAARSFVPESFTDPDGTFAVNINGTLHLLQALVEHGFAGRMLFVSSGDIYGLVPEGELPIRETRPLLPRSPYAVSKVAAEALVYQWSQTQSAFACLTARSFNHIGPGQSPRFAVSDFARQVVSIRRGRQAPAIAVGDIDTTRDFTDVRDVVTAYLALLDRGLSGRSYNVCSGTEVSLRAMLARLLVLAGVTAEIRQDPARLRPAEQRRVRGDHAQISTDTGWSPRIPLDATLTDLLHHWESHDP